MNDFSDVYINRELSWLEFERRILSEATRDDVPLLERLKFHAIFATNLDEFFMVRLAGLMRQVETHVMQATPDGRTPQEAYEEAYDLCRELTYQLYDSFTNKIIPELRENGVRFLKYAELDQSRRDFLTRHFQDQIYPLLTPVGVDPSHPFPNLNNKTINIGLLLTEQRGGEGEKFAIVQVPTVVSRFIRLPSESGRGVSRDFIMLGDLIGQNLDCLFPGFDIKEWTIFRLTRDSDLSLDEEEEGEDLLESIRKELLRKKRAAAVRLEIRSGTSPRLLARIRKPLGLDEFETIEVDGLIHLGDTMELVDAVNLPSLRYPGYQSQLKKNWEPDANMFASIRAGDVLFHHPYDSFEAIVNLIHKSVDDPKVQAIKMTLYRAGTDPRIINSLIRAAENGKQVTVLVELKARFDEQNNISRAHELERAGVHVVYGIAGLKIHCKMLLIVRKETSGIMRYVHMSTGNYNPITARIYTDIGYLTCRRDFGEDASTLFNYLTGFARPTQWKQLLVAPLGLQKQLARLIRDEVKLHKAQGGGRIVLKMNALVDHSTIEELYEASNAGVKVDLIVRGICCLRPGVPGVSENIRVISHIDKYLEHSRIYSFANGGDPKVFVGSADWMPRNFYRRVEILFPILESKLKQQCVDLLDICLHDNTNSHWLRPDGTYERPAPVDAKHQFREQLIFEKLTTRKLTMAKVRKMMKTLDELAAESGEAAPIEDEGDPAESKAESGVAVS